MLLHGSADSFKRTVEITNSEAIKEPVTAGFGVAVVSSLAMRRDEESGLFRLVQDVEFRLRRPLV